jgi:hypothetical protein
MQELGITLEDITLVSEAPEGLSQDILTSQTTQVASGTHLDFICNFTFLEVLILHYSSQHHRQPQLVLCRSLS